MSSSKSSLLYLWLLLVTLGFTALSTSTTFAQDEDAPATAEVTAEEEVSEPAAAEPEVAEPEVGEEAAPEPADAEPEAAGLSFEEETTYTINTLIMFVCAVLVLFMQAGFAMLEVGLNSAKNTVNILFKNVMDLSIGVLLFLFIGYGIMYPGDAGAGKWFAMPPGPFVERDAAAPNMDTTWSNSADFLFQVAFAATAATIVSGAVAGRMKFGAYLVYSAILTGLIYPISGMWKWGGGVLAEWGFADFAGSVVVHAVGGFAGLAGAIVLGARLGRFSKDGKSVPMPGHNIAFAALGVFILWVGWYGFNPGSQLTYSGAANAEATTYIALTTTIAAAAGALVAMTLAWMLFKKPDVTMALNGVLAGLVGITANCDQVTQVGALVIGGVAGVLVVAGIVLLDKLRIDDPVGAFPVHGLCGVWGGLATGILGTAIPDGMSRVGYIGVQALSTAIICGWAFVTMFGVFYALKLVGCLRVSPEEEAAGLDVSEHGMHAYPSHLVADSFSGSPAPVSSSPALVSATPSAEGA